MPHSPPRRRQYGSTAGNHAPKSPTLLELRQLAGTSHVHNYSGQQRDDDNSDDEKSSAASSEDSNPIIWEDDAGTDLRHLFTRRKNSNGEEGELLPTMTQQVDEMLNMEDSDSSDDDENENNRTGNAVGNNVALEHTPPAAATRSGKNKRQKIVLLDSGDVPATISKVKRRRRPNEKIVIAARAVNKVGSINNNNCVIEEAADDVEKRKLAATQDVDRVYDLLGLSSTTKSRPNKSSTNQQQQQRQLLMSQDTATLENINETISHSMSTLPSSSDFSTTNNIDTVDRRRLSFHDNRGGKSSNNITNNNGKRVMRHYLSLSRGRGGQIINQRGEEFGSRQGVAIDEGGSDDNGVESLLKEIEQGLDQVNHNDNNANEASGGDGSCPKPTAASTTMAEHNNFQPISMSNRSGKGEGIGSPSLSATRSIGIENINATNAQHQSTVSSSCGTAEDGGNVCGQNRGTINNTIVSGMNTESNKGADNDSYNFDDDDEEIEYMRGLSGDATLSTQASQNCVKKDGTPSPAVSAATTSAIPCPVPAITTSMSNNETNIEMSAQGENDSYGFLDDEGDDDEWANFEPTATQQCSTDVQTKIDDDDDDFGDDFDFAALDKQVEQRLETIQKSDNNVSPPPSNAPVHNRRCGSTPNPSNEPLFLSFTRYVVRRVRDDLNTYTKTIDVSLWTPREEDDREDESGRLKKICSAGEVSTNVSADGCIHLRGEWYHTNAKSGDIIHLCSISGTYLTDVTALPVVLHSNPPVGSDMNDDLLLVIHPDELITPTLVSEAVKCPRLAVLQSRLGSTGLSAKSAVVGTLRHDLFERCVREKDSSRRSAALFTREIIRNNADALVGCGITDRGEAFSEVIKTLPQIQSFLDTYTSWNSSKKGQQTISVKHSGALLKGMFPPCDAFFSVDDVFATEEWALVPELGLKGNVDATVRGRINPVHSSTARNGDGVEQDVLVPVELKTGHNQNPQHNHLAQLSVYTIMLRARHGSTTLGDVASNKGSEGLSSVSSERGAASSGVLIYLNDKAFNAKHVKPSLADVKTLVGQRNGIVCDVLKALTPRGVALEYQDGEKSKVVVSEVVAPPSALPQLISNTSSCERCYKNRECMMYASADSAGNGQSSNMQRTGLPHRRLIDHFTSHLNREDLEYFRKWDRLIDLERHATPSDIAKSWLYNSDEKEAKDGRCISSMVLDKAHLSASLVKINDEGCDEKATLRFFRAAESKSKRPLTNLHFEKGTYVIIRTDECPSSVQPKQVSAMGQKRRQRILIFRGSVANVTEASIDIVLQQKDVNRLSRNRIFRIDRDELSNGAGILLQNLVNFFTLDIPAFSTEALGQTPLKMKQLTQNTDSSARRRRLTNSIIRLEPPPRFGTILEEDLFSETVSFVDLVAGCDKAGLRHDFAKLNTDQKAAVLKVVNADDFAIIQGLPGTGKSATIAFLTRLLVARGKRVLLTSYTHSAVDNLLSKLMKSGVVSSEFVPNPIVRIGRESSCHSSVHALLAHNIARETEEQQANSASPTVTKPNPDVLFNVVSSARVVGVSALTAPRSPLLAGQKFDVVIVDEAGQISQPAILGAIMAADSFVLVGDHMQLPPLVVSEVADQAGYGVSMLKHLAEGFPDAVAKLTLQYRMNEDICCLSNIVAYKGLLKCANDSVKNQKLNLSVSPKFEANPEMTWIEKVVNPNNPVVFLDCTAKESKGPVNAAEISIVERCIESLSDCGVAITSIGVITPFRSQLRALKDNLNQMCKRGLEISTIDRFQGRDKSVTIISLVRSNSEGKAGRLLQDFRRLNVAFSRAKHKMIIIGSYSTLHRGSEVLRPVLESCRKSRWVQKCADNECVNITK